MTDELLYSREIVFMPADGRADIRRRRVLECPRCHRQAVVYDEKAVAQCVGPEHDRHPLRNMDDAPRLGVIG